MGQMRRLSVRVVSASLALVVLAAACGPSQHALFAEALADGWAALAADDLELAEERLSAAGGLRPDDSEFLAAWQTLHATIASRNTYLEAERLADAGQLLAARNAFLQVATKDAVRFELAQAAALSVEKRWLDQTAATLDDLLDSKDLNGVVLAINRARQDFPYPALEQQIVEPRTERVLQVLADVGMELVAEEQINDIEILIQRVTAIFTLSESEGSVAVRSVSELAASERARITRIRLDEAARRQNEALQALQPRRPTTTPPSSGDCPSPVTDPAGFQRCLDARLAGVPSASDPSSGSGLVPEAPRASGSCPTFEPGVHVSLGAVSGTISEDRYGIRRLVLAFDGSITNASVGWMRVFQYSYVLFFGSDQERHPGHAVQITSQEGPRQGDWFGPNSVFRFREAGSNYHVIGDQVPTHIEFSAGASVRASEPPEFCNPAGDWYFDRVRVRIAYE
jgi:hypothetical protein